MFFLAAHVTQAVQRLQPEKAADMFVLQALNFGLQAEIHCVCLSLSEGHTCESRSSVPARVAAFLGWMCDRPFSICAHELVVRLS